MDDSLISGVYSKYSNKYMDAYSDSSGSSVDGNYLDFDSYLKLLVAQMQNQDFNDPMSDSEVLAQMAQYSMLEGIKNMTQQSNISYAMSLVGRVVTVSLGQGYITGSVESVTIYNGEPALMINGKAFSIKSVSDVVDPDVYSQLKEMVGKTVIGKNAAGEDIVKGKVTDVLFLYGNSYVVVNGEVYPAKYVSIVDDEADDGETEGTPEVGEGETDTDVPETDDDTKADNVPENGAENAGESGNTDTETESIMNTGYVVNKVNNSYLAKSQELVDILMRELDEINDASNEISKGNADYVLKTAELQVPNYYAAFIGDYDFTLSSPSNVNVTNTYGSGTISKADETSESRSTVYNSDINTVSAQRTYGGRFKGVTGSPAIIRGDDIPQRISVENYPEEAALADSFGTRMYDIRFINNRAITSRIKTDKVIGRTQSGKEITEIGYSGVGQLGEVVTFKDGTQRVEILLKSGHSAWLTTSGNFTLDEICVKGMLPEYVEKNLTPQEIALRHFSRPSSQNSQSALNYYNNYLAAQGITQ